MALIFGQNPLDVPLKVVPRTKKKITKGTYGIPIGNPGWPIDPFKTGKPAWPIDPFKSGKPAWPIDPFSKPGLSTPVFLPGGAPTATAKPPVVEKKTVKRVTATTKKPTKKPTTTVASPTVGKVGVDLANPAAPTTTQPGTGGMNMKDLMKQLGSIMGVGPNTKGLAQLAAKLASQAVQAEVAGYTTQQDQLMQQGRSQALNILAASRAAANLQNNFGSALNTAYGNAADETAKIAGGYAGELQNLAQGEAAQIAQQVAAAGGTFAPPGGANVPQAAYNALYGLQGAIPATSLANQAVTSMKQAQALPMITRGAGTQGALLAQGAANQSANALLKNIANARAQLPRLTQSYLSNLTSAATANEKNKLAGLSLALNAAAKGQSVGLQTWKAQTNYDLQVAKLKQNAQIANTRYTIQKWNATTSRMRANETAANNAIKNGLTRNKTLAALAKTADLKAKDIAATINKLVFGEWSKPTTSGGRTIKPMLINPSVAPEEAIQKLMDLYPSLASNKQGRALLLQQLARAYGPLRAVRVDGGDPIIIGWPKSGDFSHYPISAIPAGESGPLTGTG